ncbi:MAG TPA: hypothetical protein VK797_01410 [Tepidisphaeraceae bacterium]|nr:hypothetical protein [Tepidisphaeraceae bacterium]
MKKPTLEYRRRRLRRLGYRILLQIVVGLLIGCGICFAVFVLVHILRAG